MPLKDRIDPNLLKNVENLPISDQEELLKLIEELEEAERKEAAQDSFMNFVKYAWPAFIEGRHHKIMGNAFDRVASGELKRLIVNMPPRHTKSEFASYLLPAWFLGRFPEKKIIQTAHTAELSVGFGRKVRNLVDSDDFKKVFSKVALRADSKAAGRWSTNEGGEYFAIGVGGAVTGKGADLLIIDDPHSEQEGQSADPSVFDKVYEWYTSGPRQRLQPGGAIVVVMTRWHKRDLTGQILKSSLQRSGTDEWELVKREWWREWEEDRPPHCEFIIQSWDTAFLKTQRSDYSACTTWGVFYKTDDEGLQQPNIILMDAFKERLEFPELKKKAYEYWSEWQPDAFVVEAKAAGTPLIFELRAMGIPVSEYTPSRGNDKIARVNAVADLFASGIVWAPKLRYAEEVIEEFAAFPAGEHDDLVDSSTQALLRFRQGGFLKLNSDEEDEPFYQRKANYY